MPKFSPDFIDELKARLRPSDVIGRHVKLQKRGALWWGLSPFKREKTASFTVNDERRSYHCYSTDNHGDIISFLQETQNLSFVEAVSRLADEAGMEIPADDPRAADAAKARKGLAEACNAAAGFFQAMLARQDGAGARAYLERRGLRSNQIEAFSIGYAPGRRSALRDYLINKGFEEKVLVEAGLLIKPDDGGAAFDRFRDRVMFPIRGPRNDVIAFGGRALDPNARAKYLNSPETPIFHKSDVLYNHDAARAALAKDGGALIVCEGYMDVVALWGAGFRTAVAPLGTALTERQLSLLWRVSDEPALCFDGDGAGVKAAYRAVDRALPMLKPGKSLSFVFLPDGKDPDDVVQAGGPGAFDALMAEARPLVDVLWSREAQSRPLDTPERKAAFRTNLRALVKTIVDPDVRGAYAVEIANRFRNDFDSHRDGSGFDGGGRSGRRSDPRSGGRVGGGRGFGGRGAYRSTLDRLSVECRPVDTGAQNAARARGLAEAREATLVLCVLLRPALAASEEDAFFSLKLTNSDLDRLMGEVIGAILANPGLDTEELRAHLQQTPAAETMELLLANEWLNKQSFLRPEAELHEAVAGWRDALRHHVIATDSSQELSDSARVFSSSEDDVGKSEDVWRAAAETRNELAFSRFHEGSGSDAGDASEEALRSKLERMGSRFRN